MEFDGTMEILRPVDKVMEFVSNSRNVVEALPGLESSEVKDDTHLSVRVKMGTSFIKGKFNMDLEIERKEDNVLEVKGKGKGSGSSLEIRITARIMPIDSGRCRIDWAATAQVGGAIASIGSRFIQASAKSYLAEFIENVKEKLESS